MKINKHFIEKTEFDGLLIIHNFQAFDNRGSFEKDYSDGSFFEGINFKLREVFYTKSKKNVIRANHFQLIKPQAKYVRVLSGKVLDVVVDLRVNSPTYKKYFRIILDSNDNIGLYIPIGFSHGYRVLEEAIVSYKCDEVFFQDGDFGFKWNDPSINIDWGENIQNPILSQKDIDLPSFLEIRENIKF